MKVKKWSPYFTLIGLALLCVLIYWPATKGPFLFDDMSNLAAMQLNGGIVNFSNWLDFVFGGKSATGRPLSLATFTLNAQNWPADPFPFKLTNIIIHCLNSVLVYQLLVLIFARFEKITCKRNYLKLAPFFGAALWLLHPVHVTTILQVVQRMTLLNGTFIFVSLIVYIRFINTKDIKPNRSFLKLVLVLTALGSIGVLAKETVVLLPFYMFAIGFALYREKLAIGLFSRSWQIALLAGPILLFILATIILKERLNGMWLIRDFNIVERILTECRILFEYMSNLFVPSSSNSSLFHDDQLVSRNLLSPISTLVSMFSIIALVLLAIIARKKFPLLSLGILWFFLGHSLEATILPIELYFEHRNYIPSLSIVFILTELYMKFAENYRKAAFSMGVVYVLLCSLVTALTTVVWKDKFTLMTTWAEEKPNSIRAQQEAAYVWLYLRKDPVKAREYLVRAFNANKKSTSTRIRLLQINCYFDQLVDNKDKLIAPLANTNFEFGAIASVSSIIKLLEDGLCHHYDPEFLLQLLTNLENNPRFNSRDNIEFISFNKARVHFINSNFESSLIEAQKALELSPYVGTAVFLIEVAEKLNNKEQIIKYLVKAKELKTTNKNFVSAETNRKLEHFINKYELNK